MVRLSRNESTDSSSSSNITIPDNVIQKEARITRNANTAPALRPLDPNQMFILSGPFPTEDPKCGMLIAKPIPPGCTVIARPMMGTNPFTMSQEQMRPLSPSMIKTESTPTLPVLPDPNSIKIPMVMMWTNECPEGKYVPLRQPAPPVYFQNKIIPE